MIHNPNLQPQPTTYTSLPLWSQIDEEERVTMIDFPQMVSVAHKNAEM